MRIITWNCNMAFRKKVKLMLDYNPDILVIPECEHPEKLKFSEEEPIPADTLWFGANQHKGLGIFSYGEFKLSLLSAYNPEFKMIIPIEVTGGPMNFNLFAIWANNPSDPEGQYVEQIWKAIHYYDTLLTDKPTILIGDFNSNTIWDKKRRAGNHSNIVKVLSEKGIKSTYHHHHNQEQGTEKHPTLYMYRHKNKPYHIDYCFASATLLEKVQSVEIGDFESWMPYSDHVPVIVTFV